MTDTPTPEHSCLFHSKVKGTEKTEQNSTRRYRTCSVCGRRFQTFESERLESLLPAPKHVNEALLATEQIRAALTSVSAALRKMVRNP